MRRKTVLVLAGLAAQSALGATGTDLNDNSAVNPISSGLMDFTSPSAPTFIPPGSSLLSPVEPPLMGSEISQSPTLLDYGTGWPSSPAGTPVGSRLSASPELPNPNDNPWPLLTPEPNVQSPAVSLPPTSE